ncbi:MAG: CDP-diacylglycerol--glycerol-3-phosphate 3-phosphatidyltransferase [Alphaproteobacteria bacterium]|uniref:CDP-diacylglycerol--glycerol-3-phosphate 3-phosphatidyltransferase n=1 Tax=Candidatus Bodocaedibacter vickermanii TaxID=2741701 RepID=A0A7L9RU28_9PROT|nr:CDP-diacylglycerol--glycerol-3-phosphate 3-phosphatidyltransferase [Alphaproteobacteria bacterium]QOL20062.1 CDP-diacylglycerol--glycerol-3-phosphate 3-phosphatidyltransferase [Candidatus Paracaedibacteraceae bacterium 'Lake Konstanz']
MAVYTIPNFLTMLRILAIPGIVCSLYAQSFWGDWIAFSFYGAACITDFFDGYIARAMRQTSMVGRFLDPIADKLLVSTVLISYVGLGRLTDWNLIPVILIVCREIFISGLREFLADYQIRMPVSQLGKWKTTTQMLALGFLMVYPSAPKEWMTYEIGVALLWLSTLITLWSGVAYMISALRQTSRAHH